jgi:PleD family two-component response regulator
MFKKSVEQAHIQLNGDSIQYTCSIGVCNVRSADLDEMVIQADKNLYVAKSVGKNQVFGGDGK